MLFSVSHLTTPNMFTGAIALNGLAILVMIFVVAIAYGVGTVARKQEYVAFAQVELFQIFVTILLLIFLLGGIVFFETLLNTWACSLLPQPDCSMENIAIRYLDRLLFDQRNGAVAKAFELKLLNFYSEVLLSGGQRVSYTGWGIKKGIEVLRAVGTVGTMMTNSLYTPFLFFIPSLYLQRYLINLIPVFSLEVLLPVGLFLRTLPPTRSGGTFLIALATGLKTIFVFSYTIHAITVSSVVSPFYSSLENVDPSYLSQDHDIDTRMSYMLNDSSALANNPVVKDTLNPDKNQLYKTALRLKDRLTSGIDNVDFTVENLLGVYAAYNFFVFITRTNLPPTTGTSNRIGRLAVIFSMMLRGLSGLVVSMWIGFGIYQFLKVILFITVPEYVSLLSWYVLQGIFLPALSFVLTNGFVQTFHRFLSNITAG